MSLSFFVRFLVTECDNSNCIVPTGHIFASAGLFSFLFTPPRYDGILSSKNSLDSQPPV